MKRVYSHRAALSVVARAAIYIRQLRPYECETIGAVITIELDFKPRGVCARMIHVELSEDGQTIENVSFEGGCNGNLKAIGKLVAGQPVDRIVEMLEGNTCGPRKTSCADQMTRALREAQGQIAE